LKTPGGRPASWTTSANSKALSGDNSLGFNTIVQPAASAGATLAVIWYSGQFQGVMRPQTPMASRMIAVLPRAVMNGKLARLSRAARTCSAASGTCA
jgi:hypothetical protein